MPEPTGDPQLLTGWGRTAPSRAQVVSPSSENELSSVLSGATAKRGVIARGLGRSYGDAAQCAGGTVVDARSLLAMGFLDRSTGEIEVGAGTSLHELLERTLPAGWFIPVSPGTRQVTVGGAIAADVHGKNHHRDGSFAQHVSAMTLATPTGVHHLGPDDDAELFWATAGGMGLTGVVTKATVRMIPVETDQMIVDTERYGDLDAVMAAMESGDDRYRYSVAWVDCTATGRHTGRAVLTRGDHAMRSDLSAKARDRSVVAPGPPRLRIPRPAPGRLLNPLTVAAFNELWFRRAPHRRIGEILDLAGFFHPLDGVGDWNLLYGARGFLQYQFVVGPDHSEVVGKAIDVLASARVPSILLAVLKRFGDASPGLLSFPIPGWTLALDVPLGPPHLGDLLDRIDEMVAEAGGRVYLAKDSRLRPDLVAAMYPRLAELAGVRKRVDPAGLLRSDLSRRLRIDGAEAPRPRAARHHRTAPHTRRAS